MRTLKFLLIATVIFVAANIGIGVVNFSANSEPTHVPAIENPCPDQLTCKTIWCGGNGSTEVTLCCPTGYKYLDHCNCECWKSSSDFDCSRFSICYDYSD